MPGYRTWSDTDTLDAPDLNNFLMGQSLPRFASAEERDAQMGGVVPGQVSYLVDADRFDRVSADGTWTPLVPDAPPPPVSPVKAGSAQLAGETTVVPCPGITDTAVIMLTVQSVEGVTAPSVLAVTSRSIGDQTFTITASQPDDVSTVGWLLTEPTT